MTKLIKTFVRKPLTAKFIQYDGSSEMTDWLDAEYLGVFKEGSYLFLSDSSNYYGQDEFQEIFVDDWLMVKGFTVIDVIDPLEFKEMYEEVK